MISTVCSGYRCFWPSPSERGISLTAPMARFPLSYMGKYFRASTEDKHCLSGWDHYDQ